MGNSFVLFDVSIVISHGQFHTQNTDFPWVKSHFPVGKRSSGTAANVFLTLAKKQLHHHVTPVSRCAGMNSSSTQAIQKK